MKRPLIKFSFQHLALIYLITAQLNLTQQGIFSKIRSDNCELQQPFQQNKATFL